METIKSESGKKYYAVCSMYGAIGAVYHIRKHVPSAYTWVEFKEAELNTLNKAGMSLCKVCASNESTWRNKEIYSQVIEELEEVNNRFKGINMEIRLMTRMPNTTVGVKYWSSVDGFKEE